MQLTADKHGIYIEKISNEFYCPQILELKKKTALVQGDSLIRLHDILASLIGPKNLSKTRLVFSNLI